MFNPMDDIFEDGHSERSMMSILKHDSLIQGEFPEFIKENASKLLEGFQRAVCRRPTDYNTLQWRNLIPELYGGSLSQNFTTDEIEFCDEKGEAYDCICLGKYRVSLKTVVVTSRGIYSYRRRRGKIILQSPVIVKNTQASKPGSLNGDEFDYLLVSESGDLGRITILSMEEVLEQLSRQFEYGKTDENGYCDGQIRLYFDKFRWLCYEMSGDEMHRVRIESKVDQKLFDEYSRTCMKEYHSNLVWGSFRRKDGKVVCE